MSGASPVVLLIGLLLGLGWFCLMGGVAWVLWGPERARGAGALQRMRALSTAPQDAVTEALFRPVRPATEGRSLPFIGDVGLLLKQAELQMTPARFLTACGAAALAIALCAIAFVPPLVALALGAVLGVFGPVTYLRQKHTRRVEAFTMQLPDALELMMRGLRVGHPVSVTISNVVRTMPDPIGAEFRKLGEQINHGEYLTEAFKDLADRMGQEDMDYLSVSLSIQHGTGGNLAEMLGTLSKVIRDRIMMRRRVKAISAEGRISALLLSSLPVVIYIATSLSAPNYYGDVMDNPYFMPIAGVIIALVVANALALRKLVNFEI